MFVDARHSQAKLAATIQMFAKPGTAEDAAPSEGPGGGVAGA